MPRVGSSRIRRSGSDTATAASPRRSRSPLERSLGCRSAAPRRPTRPSAARARRAIAADRRALTSSSTARGRGSGQGPGEVGRSRPARSTRPASGSSNPATILARVVFPEPFGPRAPPPRRAGLRGRASSSTSTPGAVGVGDTGDRRRRPGGRGRRRRHRSSTAAPGSEPGGGRRARRTASSRGASRADVLPRRRATRSASASARPMRCSERTNGGCRARAQAARNASAPSGSSCEVGSSRRRSPGRSASAEARQTRCSSPPDSSNARRSTRCSASTAASAASTRAAISAGGVPTFSRPNATSFRPGHHDLVLGILKDRGDRAGQLGRPCPPRVGPAIVTRPAKRPPWKWGTSPARARRSVDFPEPDGPSTATISPDSTRARRRRAPAGRPG